MLKSRLKYNLCSLAVLILALALRVPNITERSIWYDEASSWQTASFGLRDLFESVRLNVHLPLYYLLLKTWMAVFGESAAAIRGFSVTFGVLSVYAAERFGRELYLASSASRHAPARDGGLDRGARVFGLVLAALLAVSAYQVHAAVEARMYSLGTMAAVTSSWLLLLALRRWRDRWPWIAYGAACLALLYCHHYALFTVATQFAFLGVYALVLRRDRDREKLKSLVPPVAALALLLAIAYLPGAVLLKTQVGRVRLDYWIEPLSLDSFMSIFANFVIPGVDDGYVPYGAPVELVVLASAAYVAAGGRRGDYFVVASACLPIALAASASAFTPIWVARYFRFVQPFAIATVALAAWKLPRGRRLVLALVFAILLGANYVFWKSLGLRDGTGIRGAVEAILARHRGDELIVALDLVQYFPAKFYAGRHARIRLLDTEPKPFWGGHLVRPVDLVAPDTVANELAQGVWVIGDFNAPAVLTRSLRKRACVTHDWEFRYYHPLHRKIRVRRYQEVVLKKSGASVGGTSEPLKGK